MTDSNKFRFTTLADFMVAHALGEVPKEAHLICWTGSCTVEILCPVGDLSDDDIANGDDTRAQEVLFRAGSADEFALEFAETLGLEGTIS